MTNQNLAALHEAGVSIWLDDLSRQRMDSGNLAELIDQDSVTGVTTNPTIFAAAFQDLSLYGDDLKACQGMPADEAIRELMAKDVSRACDIFADIYQVTKGYDGRVSIEVEPGLANQTQATVEQAKLLYKMVDKPNVLIKIPATKAGLSAITQTIAAGISVNVTLIFSLDRYHEVMDAYLAGLEQAAENGHDLSTIHSVASFFVSRVDTEIDNRLEQIGSPQAKELLGKAGIANARLAFAAYRDVFGGERFAALKQAGANEQWPLWASTGTKNKAYPDTLYVAELVARPCVNTMPEKTLLAFADHGKVDGDTITPNIPAAQRTMDQLQAIGIDLADVFDVLETEGVTKFEDSWNELVESVTKALDKS